MERPRPLPSVDDLALELPEPLRRHSQRLVGNRETAEDLLPETLPRMTGARPASEGRARARTWAFSIAMRVIPDQLRAPEARDHILDLDERVAQPVDDVLVGHVAVDEWMVIEKRNACVGGVIDSWPEDYRMALVLHDLDGLTASQVAEISGCSVATAKIRIHRARARVKTALRAACSVSRDDEGVFRCDRSLPTEKPRR